MYHVNADEAFCDDCWDADPSIGLDPLSLDNLVDVTGEDGYRWLQEWRRRGGHG